jgi:hypothetical protein
MRDIFKKATVDKLHRARYAVKIVDELQTNVIMNPTKTSLTSNTNYDDFTS